MSLLLYLVVAIALALRPIRPFQVYLHNKAYQQAQTIIRNSKRKIPYKLVLLSPFSPIAAVLPRIPFINAVQLSKMIDQVEEDLKGSDSDVFLYSSPYQSYFITRDIDISRKVLLSNRTEMVKPSALYEVVNFFGPNIVSTEGSEWLRHRKVIQPAFSDEALRYAAVATTHYAQEIVSDWVASKGKPVSVMAAVKTMTMKVICDAGFGFDLSNDVSVNGRPTMMQSLTTIIDNLIVAFVVPHWLTRSLPIATLKNLSSSFDAFQANVEKLIRERNEDKTGGGRKDLLTLMLLANDHEDQGSARLTDRELLSDSFIFLFAGHETSANTLTWALAYLSYHPEVQEKLYAHVIEAIGKDRDPTYEDYRNLWYAEAVAKEALRLRSPVTDVFKVAVKDIEIEGVFVPKDGIVDMFSSVIQKDKRFWPNPHQFDPSNFSDPKGESAATSSGSTDTWFPFSRGPRACVGFRFALIEMTLALTILSRKFIFHPKPGVSKEEGLRYSIPLLLTPATDIHVVPEERS